MLAGLWASRRLGIKMPVIHRIARIRTDETDTPSFVMLAVAAGVVGALAIIGIDALVFSHSLPKELALVSSDEPIIGQIWRGALASLYGGIAEELLLRLGLLCLTALGLRALFSRGRDGLGAGVFWTANIVTSVIFGLGHLPATAALVPLTPMIIVRSIVLNAIVGLGCGWLMWRRCLEAAIVCHFSADIVLHVLLPAFQI